MNALGIWTLSSIKYYLITKTIKLWKQRFVYAVARYCQLRSLVETGSQVMVEWWLVRSVPISVTEKTIGNEERRWSVLVQSWRKKTMSASQNWRNSMPESFSKSWNLEGILERFTILKRRYSNMDIFWYVIIGIGVSLNVLEQIFGGNDRWGE